MEFKNLIFHAWKVMKFSGWACGRLGGLMVSVLDSEWSGLGSGSGGGHCVVFLGKTLYIYGSFHPGV